MLTAVKMCLTKARKITIPLTKGVEVKQCFAGALTKCFQQGALTKGILAFFGRSLSRYRQDWHVFKQGFESQAFQTCSSLTKGGSGFESHAFQTYPSLTKGGGPLMVEKMFLFGLVKGCWEVGVGWNCRLFFVFNILLTRPPQGSGLITQHHFWFLSCMFFHVVGACFLAQSIAVFKSAKPGS